MNSTSRHWFLVAALAAPFGGSGCTGRSDTVAARLVGRPQSRTLTCESRSAADLLAFHGIAISELEVFARIARSDNPDLGFVGDPDGPPGRIPPEGYGVHAGPVAAVVRDLGLDATAVAGESYAWLMDETREGWPVIAWITASCDPSARTRMSDSFGRKYSAVRGEHTVLVLSADPAGVTVLDPAGGVRRRFDRAEFEAAWALFDRSAIRARGRRSPAPLPSK